MGWFNTFQRMERGISRTVSASCREGDDTLRDQARQLYLFGSRKVAVNSTKICTFMTYLFLIIKDESQSLLQHTNFPVFVGFNR